ncbi:hypothetical protein Taro_020121 [Colocasia esculenta]|uniref:Uncharacterized protein n=1 Tax=Colocasia esculenta TaxID=4460 RepID=A0A843UVF9_COLES|nr:hypothetical protein [Colocasia esculenta]
MVKSVVGEETRLQSFEERLSQSALRAQVGLVIGRLSLGLDRGFVYDLVPTPMTDAGLPPCSIPDAAGGVDKRKGSKGGGGGRSSQAEAAAAPLSIDTDWVAEHARQVSRMLLGGMYVVGIYVWASEGSFKASNLVLWQTIKSVAQAAPFYDGVPPERLLVHASYSPRRLPIVGESNAGAFKDVLRGAIANHSKELKGGAKALVDGKLVTEGLQSSPEGVHEVELLLPLMNSLHYEGNSALSHFLEEFLCPG